LVSSRAKGLLSKVISRFERRGLQPGKARWRRQTPPSVAVKHSNGARPARPLDGSGSRSKEKTPADGRPKPEFESPPGYQQFCLYLLTADLRKDVQADQAITGRNGKVAMTFPRAYGGAPIVVAVANKSGTDQLVAAVESIIPTQCIISVGKNALQGAASGQKMTGPGEAHNHAPGTFAAAAHDHAPRTFSVTVPAGTNGSSGTFRVASPSGSAKNPIQMPTTLQMNTRRAMRKTEYGFEPSTTRTTKKKDERYNLGTIPPSYHFASSSRANSFFVFLRALDTGVFLMGF